MLSSSGSGESTSSTPSTKPGSPLFFFMKPKSLATCLNFKEPFFFGGAVPLGEEPAGDDEVALFDGDDELADRAPRESISRVKDINVKEIGGCKYDNDFENIGIK